jgi:hypothetical protein
MSSIASTTSNWLQSVGTGSNWLQSAATSSSSNTDWLDSSSAGSDPVVAAANAFAAAEQTDTSDINTLVVNEGIATLSTQAASLPADDTSSSPSVDILA